jgi:hypothetical protein
LRKPSLAIRVPVWSLFFAACAGTACEGVIGEADGPAESHDDPTGFGGAASSERSGGTSSSTSPPDPGSTTGGGGPQAPAAVGESPLRRLGKTELSNTLRELFPDLPGDFEAKLDLPADNDIQLAFSLPGTVSDLEVKRFMDLAEAALAALGPKAPNKAFSCGSSGETACARSFVNAFGKRVFRRPVSGVEADDLVALYAKLRSDPEMSYGFRDALGVLVEAMLQSPAFLYRWERGLAAPRMDGPFVKFDDYEIASRLSYFLWNSAPDAELMAAADGGELSTPEQIAEQASRLLADPRADATLGDFITQWLELGPLKDIVKDTAVYPSFKPELSSSMRQEVVAFSKDVLRSSEPTFAKLLTGRYTFVDAPLAKYYGLSPDVAGRVDLAATPRLGLLTDGALMAVKGNSYRTSPVRRGKFILNRLLCTIIPPPPPNVVPELPPPDPAKTLREQMAIHRSDPSCATCHARMDPLGFAFEHFDGAGKYRADDGGHAIDASGSIELDGASVNFRDAGELATALSTSREAGTCFARQWLRYAIDRFEQDADRAAVIGLSSLYEKSGFDTRHLIVEITRTLPFTHRAPAENEDLTP